jgi:SAM-dependent methyltransferase
MNVTHWYDGLFYDLVIAPHQDRAFTHVRELIPEGASLLDVGCATGRLALQLAGKCGTIDAIDPSMKNIRIAEQALERHPARNVRFHHADALQFLDRGPGPFDFATISYMIHEVAETERNRILSSVSTAARKIILVDYLVPPPTGTTKVLNGVVEFLAGAEHFRNFRSFLAGNGLRGIVERAGLSVLSELKNDPPSTHIVVAAREAG